MLVLQSKYSKFLFTICTVQSWVRQQRDYQPVMEAAAGCWKLLKFCLFFFFASFFLHVLLTGLVRKRTAEWWQRSTASTKTSKRSSVCWRPCSVNQRTQPRPVELTHSGTCIDLKRTRTFLEKKIRFRSRWVRSCFRLCCFGKESWWSHVTI